MENTLLVFIPDLTARARYTFSLFFDYLIPTNYRLTQNAEEYKNYMGPKFCYAKQVDTSSFFLASSGLLFKTGIHQQDIQVSDWEGLKIFYKVNEGILPFDIFSAAFYLVSRYEEYTTTTLDMHKRFRAQDSLAFKNGFIDKPMVNLWAEKLKVFLLKQFSQLKIKELSYTFIPTIDIDVAYAHLGKKLKVSLGSYFNALYRLKAFVLIEKSMTMLGLRKDKYDTYDYQEQVFKKHKLRPIYFFLAAKRGQYDKNISTSSHRFKKLVKKLAVFGDIGIHPSYQSNSKAEIVEQEVKRVETALQSKITLSRQHFLRIKMPETYRCLSELGIKHDYSMAYASCPGFRASVCTPFPFYDLPAETALAVILHSTIVMEGTLKEYMQLSPDNATVVIEKLIKEVRGCKGEFISIWHNHSLDETGEWRGWRKVFENMIELAK